MIRRGALNPGALGAAAWRRGPLITADASAVTHVYWRNGALVDAKSNTWTPTGTPTQVGGSGSIPPGAGALSGAALYTVSGGVLNFAGDFTAAVVARLTASTGSFAIPINTGTGAVGYWGGIIQASGLVQATFYPSAQVLAATSVSVGNPFVIVFGRSGTGYFVKVSGGSSNRSTIGSHTVGATAGTIGTGLGGNAFPGVVYEVYTTSTAYSDSLASSIIEEVGTKIRRSMNWRPDSSSVAAGSVVALGDSITNGSLVATPYPTTLGTNLGANWPVTNAGVNSDRVDQMSTRWTSTYKGTGKKWVVVLGGVNDLIQGALSSDVIINRLLPLYESIMKDGARLIPVTIMPWSNHASWTAGRQTIMDEVNAWISWWCTTNSVPYVDAYNSALRTGTTLTAIYDNGDGLHPNQAGTDVLEGLIEAAFP